MNPIDQLLQEYLDKISYLHAKIELTINRSDVDSKSKKEKLKKLLRKLNNVKSDYYLLVNVIPSNDSTND